MQLYYLGAIDSKGKITELGLLMSRFPLDVAVAKLLITAVEYGCEDEMLTISAMVRVGVILVMFAQAQTSLNLLVLLLVMVDISRECLDPAIPARGATACR